MTTKNILSNAKILHYVNNARHLDIAVAALAHVDFGEDVELKEMERVHPSVKYMRHLLKMYSKTCRSHIPEDWEKKHAGLNT
jgi:hypothetical protein